MKDGSACSVVAELLPKSDAFFESVSENCEFRKGREFRVREPGLADASELSDGLVRMSEFLKIQAGKTEDEVRKSELQDAARKIREARQGIVDFLEVGMRITSTGLSNPAAGTRTAICAPPRSTWPTPCGGCFSATMPARS